MNLHKFAVIGLLAAMTGMSWADLTDWILLDDFQQFEDGQIYTDVTDIGWHGSSMSGTDEYWFLANPDNQEDIGMYVESGYVDGNPTNVWIQKGLPGGGIPPGETGTLFFRCYWTGFDSPWSIGTADSELVYNADGDQIVPGGWSDFNALIRLGGDHDLEHRDGRHYFTTNPPAIVDFNTWYNFWMVVENTWDMSVSPPVSTGVYTLYVQGPGFGDQVSPPLVPVGTLPSKDKAFIRRAPVDKDGNPQAIIWFNFATHSGSPAEPTADDAFRLDDIYFSPGDNLTPPVVIDDPLRPAVPSNLEATLISGTQIQLTWEDNASNETGYKVSMKTGFEGDWIEKAIVEGEDLSNFLVEGLDTKQQYRFTVQAYTDESESGYSNVANASWNNPILQGAELGKWNWWELEWFGQFLEVNKDWIYHDELGMLYLFGEDSGSFQMYSSDMECWFWTSADLFPYLYKYDSYEGWYYYYTGAASEDRWFARLADETYVRAPYINEAVPQPAAPTGLKAAATSASQIRLSWNDNADYEVGYKIFMMTDDFGTWIELAQTQRKNLSYYFLSDVDTSQPISFKVQAYKYGSESEFSNVAMADAFNPVTGSWALIDDFEQFSDGTVYVHATEIGWHASSLGGTDEYWFLADPHDPENIGLFVESGGYGIGFSNVWAQKALPGGGIPPGTIGTLFFRCLWSGFSSNWAILHLRRQKRTFGI